MTEEIRKYYDYPVAQEVGVSGAGLVWFLTKDHLSPPYTYKDDIALNASQWRLGASERIVKLADTMEIKSGDITLDIGTGIGGPGRDIIDASGCKLIGANLSYNQLVSLRALSILNNPEKPTHTNVVNADAQLLPFIDSIFDQVFSINTFYHVPNLDIAISEVSRVLKRGGRFGLDDWFITGRAGSRTINNLRYNWSSPEGFYRYNQVVRLLRRNGLRTIQIIDYTEEAALFLTEERFGLTYDTQVKPRILEVFPQLYPDNSEESYAIEAAEQLRNSILYMGELYRNGQAIYRQIIAEKA